MELLKVLDALGAERSAREVALDVLEVGGTEHWEPDGGKRSKAPRPIDMAKALKAGGYRAILEPRWIPCRRAGVP